MKDHDRHPMAGGAAAVAVLLAISAAPAGLPRAAGVAHRAATGVALTAAGSPYPAPAPPPADPEPDNPVNEWFQGFKAQDLAFNDSVQHSLGGYLPTDSLPPVDVDDALIYDAEAPGNLVRGDVEALIFMSEYLSHGDFGQAGAIVAPIPIDTVQGMATLLDTNLTGLAEAIGVSHTDIAGFNDTFYLPLINALSRLEGQFVASAADLSNADPLPLADAAAALGGLF